MKSKSNLQNYLKANRKASRELEFEHFGGPAPKHKVHASKKTYNRKKMKAGRKDLLLFLKENAR